MQVWRFNSMFPIEVNYLPRYGNPCSVGTKIRSNLSQTSAQNISHGNVSRGEVGINCLSLVSRFKRCLECDS